MIAYIKGRMSYSSPTEVLIETAGLGYRVYISLQTYQAIQGKEDVFLYTSFLVKEDSQSLYGFSSSEEQKLFEQLISVSGVGPNSARILLSTLRVDELRAAIVGEQVVVLSRAKGIGPKSAKRIILELKEAVLKDSGAESQALAATLASGGQVSVNSELREEALSALLALGFQKIQVQKALNALLENQENYRDSGELIKAALGKLT